jgi:hypothetical protein
MKIERAILIAFLGNYLVNNVIAAIAAFVPAGTGTITAQYITFVILAAVLIAIMAWWYFKMAPRGFMPGLWFGILGFVVSIVVAFITGVSGVLVQTASFSTLWSVLPNFGPFLWSWSTLVLLGYWVIPTVLVGWMMGRGRVASQSAGSVSMPPRTM